MWTKLAQYSIKTIACVSTIVLVDHCIGYFSRRKMRSGTKWYLIHALGNGAISLLSLPDALQTILHPTSSLMSRLSPIATGPSSYPIVIMSSMHLYHILFHFRQLTAIDWVHHLASGGLVGLMCTFYFKGPIVNHGLLFMCGLPGGIDYVLLVLSDLGIIHRLTEKQINSYLNMWLRMPGILFNCFAAYVNCIYNSQFDYNGWISSLVFFVNMWNAIYFAQRVVHNYGLKSAETLDAPTVID